MARSYVCGFETGSLSAELRTSEAALPTIQGAATIEATIVRTGTYSLKVAPASGAAGYWEPTTGASSSTAYLRTYVRVTALPASTRGLIGKTGANSLNVRVTSTGALELVANVTVLGTSTTLLTDTTKWYRVEVQCTAAAVELQIDGVSEVATSTASPSLFSIFGAFDTTAATYTAYFDDIVRDTAAFPGAGAVVLLRPTSLSAAGSWVEGDGAGTTGMAAAVATQPPPGVASASETAATNIESPANSATDNCDMNMTTYSSAGIVTGDTIQAVYGFVRHGEDIATGTKAGAVQIVSNPAGPTETVFTYGDDAGAHGAEVNNWRTSLTNSVLSPSVTLGTAPVLRVGKRTSTNRVVCVDFMGIYVDYTPAAVSRVPYVNQMPALIAQ